MSASAMASNSESLPTAKLVTCLQCKEESPISRRFCGSCGQLLWDPCPACGESNSTSERFCGGCGIDCHATLVAIQGELSAAIDATDALALDGRFLDAITKLENLKLRDHSQLQDLNAQIRQRLEDFPTKRQEAIEHSKRVVVDVQDHLESNRYDLAHQQLTSVPRAFRTQEISDLLQTVEVRHGESQQLRQTIKQALQQCEYQGLLPKVQRFAELNPKDQQMQELLQQLEQKQKQQDQQESAQLLKMAKSALATCDYKKLDAILKKFPIAAEDDAEVAKAIRAIKERLWLVEQLRSEPIATPALNAIADRLMKLQPHDERHAKITQQLSTRLEKAKREQSCELVPWAKPAVSGTLELKIDFLPLPTELASAKLTAGVSSQAMLIAFGLALQGLGQAEVMLNLAPKKKKSSWLKRVARREAKQAVSCAWGIDIGTTQLKAIQLAVDEQTSVLRIAESVVQSHALSEAEINEDPNALREIVQPFLDRHSLEAQIVVLNLPGTQTLGRFFDLPAPKPKQFFDAVHYEVKSRIPKDAESLYFDFHWNELPAEEESGVPKRHVLLAAADRLPVNARLAAFEGQKVKQSLVQSDCIALGNTMKLALSQANDDAAVAALEIGAATSNFVALADSSYWFRGLFQGTNTFDKAIANGLQKTIGDAELLRRQPHKLAAMHELDQMMQPEFATLAKEIQHTTQRFENETGKTLSRLFLCGAGSQQFGLLRYLQNF